MRKSDAEKLLNNWLSSSPELTGKSVLEFVETIIGMQPPTYFTEEKSLWWMEEEAEIAWDNPTRDYVLVGKQTKRSKDINEKYLSGMSIGDIAKEYNVTNTRIKTIIHKEIQRYTRLSKLEQALEKAKNGN